MRLKNWQEFKNLFRDSRLQKKRKDTRLIKNSSGTTTTDEFKESSTTQQMNARKPLSALSSVWKILMS